MQRQHQDQSQQRLEGRHLELPLREEEEERGVSGEDSHLSDPQSPARDSAQEVLSVSLSGLLVLLRPPAAPPRAAASQCGGGGGAETEGQCGPLSLVEVQRG